MLFQVLLWNYSGEEQQGLTFEENGGDKKKNRLDDVVVQYDIFSMVIALDQMYNTSGCALPLCIILADWLVFDIDAYSFKSTEFVCLSSMPGKKKTYSFAFPWKFLLKLLLHLSHMVGPCCKLFCRARTQKLGTQRHH